MAHEYEALELGEFVIQVSADGKRSAGFVTRISDDGAALTVSIHYRFGEKFYDTMRLAYAQGSQMPGGLRRIPQIETRWDYARKGR